MSGKINTPLVHWAQRSNETDEEKNYLIITISISDCDSPEIKMEPTFFDLKAKSKPHVGDEEVHEYALHIDFFKDIIPEKTMQKVANGQHYFLKIYKKDLGLEYWPRLTKEKLKYSYIKTDFDKWVDEDEQETVDATGNDEADMSQMMGGAGGMPGMPGMGGAGGMPGMPGMGGAGGMPGMEGMGGAQMAQLQQMLAQNGGKMPGMEGMGGMPGMEGMSGMPGMPGMEGAAPTTEDMGSDEDEGDDSEIKEVKETADEDTTEESK